MRIFGLAAVSALAIAFTAGAQATDLPMPYKARPIVEPAPVIYNWTGFYVGVNLGGSWASADDDGTFSAVVPPCTPIVATSSSSSSFSGIVGGAQIGYNWQLGHFVYGLEADI